MRLKRINLEGKSYTMPWNCLEEFNKDLKNKGYRQVITNNGKGLEYVRVYEYKGKLYTVETIWHENEYMESVDLKIFKVKEGV